MREIYEEECWYVGMARSQWLRGAAYSRTPHSPSESINNGIREA